MKREEPGLVGGGTNVSIKGKGEDGVGSAEVLMVEMLGEEFFILKRALSRVGWTISPESLLLSCQGIRHNR